MENEDMKKKETDDSTPQRHRKAGLKFAPKVLPKKDPKIIPKAEPQEENKALTIDKKMMTRLGSLQSIYAPGSGTKAEKHGDYDFNPVFLIIILTLEPLSRLHLDEQTLQFQELSPLQKALHQDYTCTNYPVTLLLGRPYSGDPEILGEEEFGHSSGRAQVSELSARRTWSDGKGRYTAGALLPVSYDSSFTKAGCGPVAETETDTNVNVNAKFMGDNRKRRLDSIHGCGLKELPGGLMGKILVYKSGKVKMTPGDVLFDVSVGSNCMFDQEVVAPNTMDNHCCGLGKIGKRAIVTPDIDSLLGSIEKM